MIHMLTIATTVAFRNVSTLSILTLTILQINVCLHVLTNQIFTPTPIFVCTIALLLDIMRILVIEFVEVDVVILRVMCNMVIFEQEDVRSIVHIILGEIILLIYVSVFVQQGRMLITPLKNV